MMSALLMLPAELLSTPRRQLSWLDDAGKPIGKIGEPDDFGPFALSPDGIYAAPFPGPGALRGNELEAGLPRRMFGPIQSVGGHTYEVSADGKRVLTFTFPQDTTNAPITLLQNWKPVKK